MKRLLLVTDHRFYSWNENVYDNYVFDYDFFAEYLSVFNEVTVLARVKPIKSFDPSLKISTGTNVKFLVLPDFRGIKWLLKSKKLLSNYKSHISKFDAICYRIPSIAAYNVARQNKKIVSAFELIGDPKESLFNISDSVFRKFYLSILGCLFNYQTHYIVQKSVTGSYVSFKHLQDKFPLKDKRKDFSISSIRLLESQIISDVQNLELSQEVIRIIHVGSFVPVKNQSILIELIEILHCRGLCARLQFVGDGALRGACQKLVVDKKLEDWVHFCGHLIGTENIIHELDKNDIFILPSSSEGMPRSLIEAMARGLLCFGSNRGGTTELLDNEFIFDLNDVNLIADKVIDVINNQELMNRTRQKNLEKAKFFEQSKLKRKRILFLEELKSHVE